MDLSKYKFSGKTKDGKLSFYIYSEEERVENKEKQTYQYNYDHLSEYEKRDARILLFIGKTGDGKSTAINAFFNLIKGVKLEDDYRLYLIRENPKKKGESMTDGLHLYYLRDYENKPIIIIDSQGFGDTRGIGKDKDLNKSFEFVFSNIIDHINAVCFIAKANETRMPVETKYIISCITSLFSEDVIQNLFILATHPDVFTFEDGPKFIESIEGDDNFSRIIKNMREQFCYTFDSLYILKKNDPHNEILKYSFEQITNFYEEGVKKSFNVNIKNSATVMQNRNQLIVKSNVLQHKFQELNEKQKNLNEKKQSLNNIVNQIESYNKEIDHINEMKKDKTKSHKDINEVILKVTKLSEQIKDNLMKQTTTEHYQKLVPTSKRYTYCLTHKKNCHAPCDCWFISLGRCKKYTIIGCLGVFRKENLCEECSCPKSSHRADNHRYEPAQREVPVDNSARLAEVNKVAEESEKEDKAKKEKNQKELDQYNEELKKLIKEKSGYERIKKDNEKEIKNIDEKINNNRLEIFKLILEILKMSKLLDKIALNKSNISNQLNYFESLKNKLEQIGDSQQEQIKKINELKQLYLNFMNYNKINIDDLENMSEEKIKEEAEKFFNKSK